MEAATVARRRRARRAAPQSRAPRQGRRRGRRRAAPARKRADPPQAPVRRPGGQLIPIAVGAATAVRQLPDSSLMVRMTRGRAWIGVLGVLLAGIVALNVITLSLSAAAGHIDQNIQALEEENSLLRGRDARRSGSARVRHEAAALGLALAAADQSATVQAARSDVAIAAQRLAAAGTGY